MKEKGPILAFIRRIVGYDDEFARNLAAIGQRISCLSLEQAQRHVRHLLDDESRYKVVRPAPGAAAAELLRRLPPSVRDFYVEFERVEERQGEVRLIRDEIGEAEHAPDSFASERTATFAKWSSPVLTTRCTSSTVRRKMF